MTINVAYLENKGNESQRKIDEGQRSDLQKFVQGSRNFDGHFMSTIEIRRALRRTETIRLTSN